MTSKETVEFSVLCSWH